MVVSNLLIQGAVVEWSGVVVRMWFAACKFAVFTTSLIVDNAVSGRCSWMYICNVRDCPIPKEKYRGLN